MPRPLYCGANQCVLASLLLSRCCRRKASTVRLGGVKPETEGDSERLSEAEDPLENGALEGLDGFAGCDDDGSVDELNRIAAKAQTPGSDGFDIFGELSVEPHDDSVDARDVLMLADGDTPNSRERMCLGARRPPSSPCELRLALQSPSVSLSAGPADSNSLSSSRSTLVLGAADGWSCHSTPLPDGASLSSSRSTTILGPAGFSIGSTPLAEVSLPGGRSSPQVGMPTSLCGDATPPCSPMHDLHQTTESEVGSAVDGQMGGGQGISFTLPALFTLAPRRADQPGIFRGSFSFPSREYGGKPLKRPGPESSLALVHASGIVATLDASSNALGFKTSEMLDDADSPLKRDVSQILSSIASEKLEQEKLISRLAAAGVEAPQCPQSTTVDQAPWMRRVTELHNATTAPLLKLGYSLGISNTTPPALMPAAEQTAAMSTAPANSAVKAPHRARTAFDYYCRGGDARTLRQLGETNKEKKRAVLDGWANLPAAEKQPYEAKAVQDQQRYQQQLVAYVAAGGVLPEAATMEAAQKRPAGQQPSQQKATKWEPPHDNTQALQHGVSGLLIAGEAVRCANPPREKRAVARTANPPGTSLVEGLADTEEVEAYPAEPSAAAALAAPDVPAPTSHAPPSPNSEAVLAPAFPAGVSLTAENALGCRILVPSTLWPSYECSEHGGAGWEAIVVRTSPRVSRAHESATVRFLYAKTATGEPYVDEELRLAMLRPLPNAPKEKKANQEATRKRPAAQQQQQEEEMVGEEKKKMAKQPKRPSAGEKEEEMAPAEVEDGDEARPWPARGGGTTSCRTLICEHLLRGPKTREELVAYVFQERTDLGPEKRSYIVSTIRNKCYEWEEALRDESQVTYQLSAKGKASVAAHTAAVEAEAEAARALVGIMGTKEEGFFWAKPPQNICLTPGCKLNKHHLGPHCDFSNCEGGLCKCVRQQLRWRAGSATPAAQSKAKPADQEGRKCRSTRHKAA